MTPLEELEYLLRAAHVSPVRKALECGPGVVEALVAALPERKPESVADFYGTGVIGALTGIDIIEGTGMEPGQWRLIRHDHCQVVGADVSHATCTVLGGGVLAQL